MSALGQLAQRWNAFWFASADPRPAAAFRIALGLYLLLFLGNLWPHVELLFSNQGVYAPYLVPDYAPAPWLAHLVFAAFVATAAAITVGYRLACTAPLAVALFLYHYFLQLAVKQSSFERLLLIYLIVLAFSRGDAAWSVSRPRATGGTPTVWTRRVLLLQTFALYFGAGLWKALNPKWHSGRLLEATLQSMWATPLGFAIARLDWSETTWTVLSWGVIGFELLLGPAFLWRRTRALAVVGGTLFHLANATILAIPEFLICLAPYPLFLPDATFRRAEVALRTRLARLRFRSGGSSARGSAS